MPQELVFWPMPVPTSGADARAICERLSNEKRKHNSVFRRLALRLTERHPCITKLPPGDTGGVWSAGPLDGVTDGAVYRVGIADAHAAEVTPFVVETATSIGLVAYDPEQGIVWLPAGVVLEGERYKVGQHLGLDLSGPFDATLVQRTIEDALLPILASEGFRSNRDAGIWRSDEDGSQSLRFVTRQADEAGAIAFDVDILLLDNGIRSLAEDLLAMALKRREKHIATAMGSLAIIARFHRMKSDYVPMRGGKPQFEVKSADELRQLAVRLRFLVADTLRDHLDQWRDRSQMAIAALDTGFEHHRIIGSGFHETENSFVKTTYGANLLSTDRCGGALNTLLLAAVSKAPHLRQLVDEAYERLAHVPREAYADERAKIDVCVNMLKESNMM